ncbi:jg10199 [Pararge aegeria aegeria]|uniref:Jg10199 protein n=2 Tax=Pararge aegeria TaxID=116150 RepID=A0A8S4SKZ3_9NEOP|nr:jg10199 [Pararge aegeria aegeria]
MLNFNATRCLVPFSSRGFKNFGHKRQPESTFTVLWHGFLTFTFIGMGIEWKRISKYLLGGDDGDETNSIISSPLE